MAEQALVDEVMASNSSSTLRIDPNDIVANTAELAQRQQDELGEDHGDQVQPEVAPASAAVDTDVEEHRSPAMSDHFSEAPTLLTTQSNYTANTGGRAQQSWRGGIANIWNPPSTFLSNDDSATSSSTDIPQVGTPLIQLPAGSVTEPDEPRSFFESDSESEGDTIIRSASRASSIRGQRPKLVDHQSLSGSYVRGRFYQSALLAPPRNPGPSHSKAEQILGTKLENLMDLTPAEDRSDPLSSFSRGIAAALNALTANELEKASTTALAPTTPSTPGSFNSSLVIEGSDTTARAEALDTLSIPLGGFGTLPPSQPSAQPSGSRIGVSPLDALRSNPVTRIDTIGLQRATSAPPLPHRRNRKVTIRPLDIEVIHNAHQKKLFRDSVVSTPYPVRHNSVALADHIRTPLSASKTNNPISPTKEKSSKRSLSVAQISPPEVLVLELSLAKHPFATKTVTIPIYDRSTFDDCALFSILRKTYHHTLLGFALRFLNARVLSNVTFISSPSSSASSESHPFSCPDFLTHLHHPQSGHKRKSWLQWLRKHQPRSSSTNKHVHTSPSHLGTNSNTSDPYFSADGIPRTPAFVDPRPPPPPRPSSPNPTKPNSNSSSSSPSSHQSPASALALPTDSGSPSSEAESGPPVPPKIILHHSFSLPRLASAIVLVLLFTALTTVLWVLLGKPGRSVLDRQGWGQLQQGVGLGMGMAEAKAAVGGGYGVVGDWRVDAQKRVLTGCVMGMLVFLMGSAGVVGWVGGSWAAL